MRICSRVHQDMLPLMAIYLTARYTTGLHGRFMPATYVE